MMMTPLRGATQLPQKQLHLVMHPSQLSKVRQGHLRWLRRQRRHRTSRLHRGLHQRFPVRSASARATQRHYTSS